ncbi:hypothetical protein F0562_014191 [Nyssa sinensis]|uniref:JmjC domain-containing protein n=1 Tax=Nyssa sinensis TaxID=561372 RepID=A0A5J4ZPJ6_9ASTE|nr:hypothetical protein F0562_014191 [Nyssa sinensis]
MDEDEALPDDLRCHRTDGRQWRCTRRVMDDKKLCELHYLQGRHRQHKQKVPISLKLKRKRNKKQNRDYEVQNNEIRARKREKISKTATRAKRRRSVDVSEALDKALKKMKLKRGDLHLELIREFLKRCFRSKNLEPLTIGSAQIVPYPRNVENLRKCRRKKCHWCRRSSYRTLIKCSSCRKQFFCEDCINERYFDKQEVRMACPVCRKICSCRACSANQSKDVEHKDPFRDTKNVDKIHLLHYLIYKLLPEKHPVKFRFRQAELGCNELNCCNNCKTSIVDFHRSCTSCSYNFCLSCCWEFRQGSVPGSIKAYISKYPNGKKACISGDKKLSERKQICTSRQSHGNRYLASPKLLLNWKACDDGSISCPPMAFGGCSDSLLDLRCMFPVNWAKELEVSAEEIVCSYDFPETSDSSSCCSLCRGTDHKASGIKLLRGVASREDSNDNFLYYPTVEDLHDENIEHFQKHWGKGHPVIVRNVLQSTLDLSWDPVVMFCTYLEKSSAKSQNDKEVVKAKNCLDWCEVEIGIKQIFMGSLEGQTHANMWRETLKFKVWLSSHLFQEQFPAHYAEIIHSLPLQEYMNPISGLLNLAVKLPQEMPKPDLGPCLYISYGGPEELMQADFLTKLCYKSYDMVNILVHTTDVPITTEQVTSIKKLMKKYKAQDHRESTRNTSDQKTTNQVEGKSSLYSENTEALGLQDMIGEGLHLPNGVGEVPFSGVSGKNHAISVRDRNMSNAKEDDSEFDSEVSISGTIQSFEDSDDQNFFRDDAESSSCYSKKLESGSCGAQWDIFRRRDVPKLLEYLRKHSNEFSHGYCFPKHQVVHPMLDQSFFLDAVHKMRLKEEFNIEPWTFEQHLGEAVIIPAGCPYQIRKLKSCVNVVLDFISPENVAECINLIEELRLLPVHHKAQEKKFEVKKMTLYSISAAIKEIHNLEHMETGNGSKD